MSQGFTGAPPRSGDYVCLQDQKAISTAGGTFTSGSFQTRVLNTKQADPNSLCTLSGNQFTLAAGTWIVTAVCPAFSVNRHQAVLVNTTAVSTLLFGTSTTAAAAAAGQTLSIIQGVITVAAGQVLEIQHRCQTTGTTNGFGIEGGFATEVYTTVMLRKVA